MKNVCHAVTNVHWQRRLMRPLIALLVAIFCGCGSSDSEDSGVRSAKSPYKRIKRSGSRQAVVRSQRSNYLKQVGIAIHTFHDIYRQFPVGDGGPIKYQDGKPLLSWRVYLLPFLEAEPLFNKFKLDEPWDSPHNIQLLDRIPDQYKNLNYQGLGNKTTVLAINGPGAVFDPNETHGFRDVLDGTSLTIMILNAGPDKAVPWTQPDDLNYDPTNVRQSLGDVGDTFLALFADGSVQPIGPTVGPKTLLHLFQRNDGAVINFDDLHD